MTTEEFLKYVFGGGEGFLFLSGKAAPTDEGLQVHKPFKYPENLPTLLKYAGMREDEDLYFSPMLYKVPMRRSTSVSATPVLYCDTDGFPVDQFLVPPSINIQTSPGRHASLWLLDGEYAPEEVEAASRAIALTHASTDNSGKQAGTDPGGWDLSQLLRMPNSKNLKYLVEGKYSGYDQPYDVFVEEDTSPMTVYALSDITSVYDPANLPAMPERANMDMPDDDNLPQLKDVIRRVIASSTLAELYEKRPGYGEDRSAILYHLTCELLRSGFTPEETFVVGWNAECNKHRIDGRPKADYWAYEIRKALADPNNRPRPTIDVEAVDSYEHPKDAGISTAVEYALLKDDELTTRTFVDDFVAWASSKTDAPTPYHVASALTILSCVFGEWGVALPKYGDLNLGLSFVVMGETTETRKSTARKLMKEFLRGCQDNNHQYILTSDATEEALIDALTERPNMTSLYDRDEAQKLISDVKGGKGYMKGFLETLNELYDGYARGRLRTTKQTKEAKVVFVQYLMGIRSQIQDNLEMSDFASGWGPRNIYVRGDNPKRTRDNARLQQQSENEQGYTIDAVLEEMTSRIRNVRQYWETRVRSDRSHPYRLFFDDDAWERMADLEWDLLDYFESHERIEILRPCIQRLATNAIKVATLFAMSEARDRVSLQDVINTRSYVARWMEDLLIMVDGVNQSLYARDINKLETWIAEQGGLVTSAAALTWVLKNMPEKTWRDFGEMVKVLEDRNVLMQVEDAKKRISLRLVAHE